MVRVRTCLRGRRRLSIWAIAVVLLATSPAQAQQNSVDWQPQVREKVRLHQLDAALALVDQRLEEAPGDLEAHGWRGRLLAWQGQWVSAEAEYRQVLDQAPNDTEILCGLADVLFWQGKPKEALGVIDRARALDPTQPEILLRRARILQGLGRASEARNQYRQILGLDRENREAKNALASLAGEANHEFRIGGDLSTFNYTGPAEDGVLLLTSRWTPRFSTTFTTGFYQRFGQDASNLEASTSFRLTKSNWLNVGGGVANDQGIIPKNDTFFEYGHGLRFSDHWIFNRWIFHDWLKGLEASYQQHWFWYQGAHVLTFSGTQLYYLPREWTWLLTITAARSGFTGTGIEWVPSGLTRLEFPLCRNLAGNVMFANGTENFAQVDQIGHFSARTFAGGLKYQLAPGRDIRGYVARQYRSDGQTENGFGVNYGFHF
jgi:tetratricopeptide (TPR) repeat protein